MKHNFYPIWLLVTLVFTGLGFGAHAQRFDNSKARVIGETYFEQGRYPKALEMLEKHKNKKNVYLDEAFLHIMSETYFKLGRFNEAVDCYSLLMKNPQEKIDSTFLQGLLYRSANPYQFGEELFAPQDESIKNNHLNQAGLFSILPFHILNSEESEFAPIEHDGVMYVSTNRGLDVLDKNTKVSYYDIYQVPMQELEKATQFEASSYEELTNKEKRTVKEEQDKLTISPAEWLNTKYNDGPISFWHDSIVYATRNESYRKRDEMVFNLNLYKTEKAGMNPENNLIKTYFAEHFKPNSIGHITFSPDGLQACMAVKGKYLGTGGSDLFFSTYQNNRWTTPQNAGITINTKGDEVFPFWSDDGYLYFSSDGYQGYGGLDVYRINPSEVGDTPQNIGSAVNSSSDDFSFSINKEGVGYFSSNREGGQGDDDIYKISMNRGTIHVVLVCEPELALDPWFKMSSHNDLQFENFDIAKEIKISYPNLPYGKYDLHHLLRTDSLYESVNLDCKEKTIYVDFPDPKDTLIVRFSNFRFDEHSLAEINQENFQKLVNFLKKNPDIQILIKGHTDQFGTVAYNEALGMRRCNAMEKFLRLGGVKNYIEKESFGRRQLISKTEHRLNRRVDVELYTIGKPDLLTFVPRGDRGRKVDLVLTYDNPKEFDHPIRHGFYVKFNTSRVYQPAHQAAASAHLPRSLKTLIFSESNYIFRHYIEIPFETKEEAEEYANDVLHLEKYEIQELE